MSDIASLILIGGELAFLAYAVKWFAKELELSRNPIDRPGTCLCLSPVAPPCLTGIRRKAGGNKTRVNSQAYGQAT